jgi:mannose-6-phosphate isomerase
MDRLENGIQHYAWGSRSALASLRGEPPSEAPEAELWMGAHPQLPSHVTRAGRRRTLRDWIAEAPVAELGARVAQDFGELPFLLKVLAAEEPLSLQAHPSMAQAKAGFARENAAGIPLDAPHRSYRDAHHKPELLCALTPMDALCGFRAPEPTHALFRALGAPAALQEKLACGDLRGAFQDLLARDRSDRATLVTHMVAACHAPPAAFHGECAWAIRLAEKYPGDIGVVSSLMLNLMRLEPGQALYLDAGNLHAYLHGVGVEIMASSDNVLRGGLTTKHMDEAELLSVLDFAPMVAAPVATVDATPVERIFLTPAREFSLSRLEVPITPTRTAVTGPEIWLAAQGSAALTSATGTVALAQGESVFVSPRDAFVEVGAAASREGPRTAVLYRARTGSGSKDPQPLP